MDLVDIDKVLDNLEFNEEELQKDICPITNQSHKIDPLQFSVNQTETHKDHSAKQNNLTTISAVTADHVNKFVGVSQVLSSLDEYRKNVKSLDLFTNDQNNENPNLHSFVSRSRDDDDNVDNDIEDHQDKDDGEAKNCNSYENENYDNEYDDDDVELYTGDEINKFFGTNDYGLSTNSITTSSSSTFSSGPSPVLLSTDLETSPLIEDIKKEEEETGKQSQLSSNVEAVNDNTSEGFKSIDRNENSNSNKRSDYDELALGLSSISLNPHQGEEDDEILFSLSQTGSGSSKLILKTDNFSSSLSLSETTRNKNLNSDDDGNKDEHDQQSVISPEPEAASKPAVQNIVTFCSTMDEISDTELDSILQEIDSEINSNQFHIPYEKKPTLTKVKENCQEIVKNSISPNSSGDALMNVDSFSQASTIEFVDDRADVDIDVNIDKSVNNHDDETCDELEYDVEKTDKQKKRRQRPTTLDLPARKINLYATAGQTPPMSRLYDQATSSSDDEKLCDGEESQGQQDLEQKDLNGGSIQSPSDQETSIGKAYVKEEKTDTGCQEDCVQSVKDDFASQSRPEAGTNTTEAEVSVGTRSAAEPEPEPAIANDLFTYNNPNPNTSYNTSNDHIGKIPPIWVPDQEASACMQCQQKFTLLKRRHHCRACGQVLCSVCCSQKFKLEFLSNLEPRVCVQCFLILTKFEKQQQQQPHQSNDDELANAINASSTSNKIPQQTISSPNPNNPMEYCSKIPPHRQVNTQAMTSYPSVIVPVGVLKKECSSSSSSAVKSRKRKSVIFSDGIRPGSDLANLDNKWSDAKHARKSMQDHLNHNKDLIESNNFESSKIISRQNSKSIVLVDDGKGSYISSGEHTLPPIVITNKSEKSYQEVTNNADLITRLQSETLKFVLQKNLFVLVKISHLKCCINKTVIHFVTSGLNNVGNDEIIILLELDNSNKIPKDIFVHLNEIYWEASRGHPVTELGFSMPKHLNFLGSREHGGFLYIRSSFQCLLDVNVPTAPFLIGVLIHRWEVPWAKIFPLRLMLRLGAQYRYYPSPHISVRQRDPVYGEIAQTIINVLADFRNYTYTIPTVKGMYIHMEDRKTNILIPRNRLDEVIKAINNSSDHILALGANFSKNADGHLVCIQNLKENGDSHAYSTQAINIQGQPRKVTGASFFVFNEALKSTSGLSGKCSIIEDGLMVQVLPSKMNEIRHSLTNMKDIDIVCGPIEADEQQNEVVHIQWVDDDMEINIGVKSPIDGKKMDGIPSIRIHSGIAISNNNHMIKWTEVFVIEMSRKNNSFDVSKVSEQIARKTSIALLPFLDLLVANGSDKIGLRITLSNDNVCYEAGSQNDKLPPLYMNALDNELIPTLHKQANDIGKTTIFELIFHILNLH